MKRSVVVVALLMVFMFSFGAIADASLYLCGSYFKESEEWSHGRSWYGITLRSLGGLFGADLDFRFHPSEYHGESYIQAQFNPFILLNIPLGNLKLYGGASPMTVSYLSYGDGDFNVDFHLFYLKAGGQYDFGRLAIFAHGLNMLDTDDIAGSARRMQIEFGGGLRF